MRNLQNSSVREPCGLPYAQLCKLSTEQVMAHLGAGHDDAIAVLFDRYSRLVLRVALGILRDAGEAEDITQEIFVELCRTAGTFDGSKGTAKLWILRCAYRRSLNRKRHLSYRRFYSQEEMSDAVLNESSNERSVVPALAMQESRRLAHQMLNSLDSPQRQVVEMVYFDGLSLAEVSAKTGDSAASVRHRYYRGLHKMRRLLRQQPELAGSRAIEGKPVDVDA